MKISYNRALGIKQEWHDAVLLSWISSALAPELLKSIIYATSSRKIWNNFKERFGKCNLNRIYYIWKELSMLTQSTDFVTSCYSKMYDLWDEIDVMVPSP